MAYSELVKSFERIRNYMREFYVYGFKSRDEYGMKSARSYDNERRRIESWLGDYMSFHQESSGKNVFLSLDSRRVPRNPLYKAFKAKSFTDKDITLHFYILDIFADGSVLSSKEIVDRINDDYLSHFNGDFSLDESTVRKKLKEYEELGLLCAEVVSRANRSCFGSDLCFLPPFAQRIFHCFRPDLPVPILFWVKSGSNTVRPHPFQQRLAVHRAGGDSKTDLDDLIIRAVQPNTVDLQSRIDLRLGEEVRAENCSDFSHIVQSCG